MQTNICSKSEIEFYGHKISAVRDNGDNYFLNPDDCESILDVPETPLKDYIDSNLSFLNEAVYGNIFCEGYVSSLVVVFYWLSELSKGSDSAETILMMFANEALFSRLKSAQFR